MDPTATLIERELRALQRRRGVMAHGLGMHLGPTLREAFAIADHDDAGARRRLVDGLREEIGQLPATSATVAAAALAVHQGTVDLETLEGRVDWLSKEIGVGPRTARRRIDHALRLLAGRIAERVPEATEPDRGWYVASLKSGLYLDQAQPHAVEERKIVAIVDDLSEILHRVSIPPGLSSSEVPGIEATLIYGGRLELRNFSETYREYELTLPAPIRRNTTHRYGLRLDVANVSRMAPRYLCIPLRRYDRFEVRIRFAPSALPRKVWTVDALPGRAIDMAEPSGHTLTPDPFGEVHHEFRDLRVGFAYGIQWRA